MSNYKKISDRIEELKIDNPHNDNPGLRWLNIINAGKQEINYLRKNYSFDLSHLRAIAASVLSQRPLIFRGQKYLFLILHFPAISDGKVIPGEVGFFVGHNFLITVHNNNLPALSRFFNTGKKDPDSLLSFSSESSAVLLYEILGRLIDDCYRLLDDNSLEIRKVEDLIFSNEQKKAVEKILLLRRNIINIRKIMQNHKNILKELTGMDSSLVDQKAIKQYYESLVEDSKRLWETLDNQKEMIEILNNTNESLLNDQMNSVMKTLTIFSVIVFPLTLLAAIFGMNSVNMPLVNLKHGFWVIVGIMLVSSFIMLIFFKRKKWL
ncbi:MAG TPA: magnesium transporter CorA family protein [Candidatus Saccharimonadales bacterium]|nr:magnesium transporter CorA family protein [Candidatus Saccharimonadales bacterium]